MQQFIDGIALSEAFASGYRDLKNNMTAINDLNVFPVPDGDTGTNMVHTFSGGLSTVNAESNVASFMKKLSDAVLLSARGNSGVIFSQFIRGLCRGFEGKDTVCFADFDKAFSLDPKNYGLYIDAFAALNERGYTEQGKAYLNVAMEKGEKNMSNYDKGRLFFYLEDYTNARNFLEQARSDGNRSEEVILLLGRSYEALNDSNYALKLYEDYVTQTPNGSIYNQMGLCYCAMGEYGNAIAAFEKGLSVQDSLCKQQLTYNQIIAYEKSSQFETAKMLMANYLKLYPDDVQAQREYEFLQTR